MKKIIKRGINRLPGSYELEVPYDFIAHEAVYQKGKVLIYGTSAKEKPVIKKNFYVVQDNGTLPVDDARYISAVEIIAGKFIHIFVEEPSGTHVEQKVQ